jgi:hypothetical protein
MPGHKRRPGPLCHQQAGQIGRLGNLSFQYHYTPIRPRAQALNLLEWADSSVSHGLQALDSGDSQAASDLLAVARLALDLARRACGLQGVQGERR